MQKKIKIEMPEVHVNTEERELQLRALLKSDFEKSGILAKVLVFTYENEPVSVTEITTKLSQYYKIEFDRVNVFRALQRLQSNGLLYSANSGYVLGISPNERKDIHNLIIAKHVKKLNSLPEQFRRKYNDVNYFWISNGEGLRYIEWCCKILNFKYCGNIDNGQTRKKAV